MGKTSKKTPFADFLSERDKNLQENPEIGNFMINEQEVLEFNENILNQQETNRVYVDQGKDYESLLL